MRSSASCLAPSFQFSSASFEKSLRDWGFPSCPPGTAKPEGNEAGAEAVAPDLSCSLANALQRGFSCIFFVQLDGCDANP